MGKALELRSQFVAVVAQSCPTLCDPMDYSPPGSSVHGILQARILERVAIPFSRGSSWPRDQTQVSCIQNRFFTIWATRKRSQLEEGNGTNQKVRDKRPNPLRYIVSFSPCKPSGWIWTYIFVTQGNGAPGVKVSWDLNPVVADPKAFFHLITLFLWKHKHWENQVQKVSEMKRQWRKLPGRRLGWWMKNLSRRFGREVPSCVSCIIVG